MNKEIVFTLQKKVDINEHNCGVVALDELLHSNQKPIDTFFTKRRRQDFFVNYLSQSGFD